MLVRDRLHMYLMYRIFYFPGIDSSSKGPTAYNVSSERYSQNGKTKFHNNRAKSVVFRV